jgi:dipeptidyl aminopeptidase/acylaminoacyl peptidase
MSWWRGGLAVLLLAGAGRPAAAQTKRAMTVDDFLGLRVPGEPQVSPEGGLVAFTVSTASLAENRTVSRLWLYNLTDSTSRELTRGPGSDLNPRWAPDGRSLAFISTRSGSPQVWRIRTDGGEPIQMTSVPTGVEDFVWSPDTTALYVVSDVKWPAEQEIDVRQKDYPTGARIFTGLLYRHWNEWRSGTRKHLLRVTLAEGQVTDITPLDRDVPPLALGGRDIAVSPLGTELAVVMNPDTVVATSTNNDIFLLGPDGTGMVPMTTGKGNDHSPRYSPNARWIAYLSMATPGYESDRQQVMLYDRASGERRSLTADWDVSVQSLLWNPDSQNLVVEVEERGQRNAYRIAVPTGQRTALVMNGYNSGVQVVGRGQGVVFLHQRAFQPPEIYEMRFDGRPPRQLTQLNRAALAPLELTPAESFGFVGAAGDSVFGYLIKPPKFDSTKRYPLVYLIHGGPQGAWTDSWHQRWNYGLFAARGYVVAAVNFHGSTGYGQKFTDAVSKNWGSLPYEDLMKGLDLLTRLPYVDRTRVGAAGASFGGYMVYWMAGKTDRFRALVAHDGIFSTESMVGTTEELWFPIREFGGSPTTPAARALIDQWSPAQAVGLWKTPILIVHGQLDYRVDVSEGIQAYTFAKLRNVPSKFLYFPDEGHFVLKPRNRRLWWGVVLDWLDEHLKK